MPYVSPGQRALLLSGSPPTNQGELNFLLTTVCLEYLKHNFEGDLRYKSVNDIVGALECCKLEVYRRLAIPLEDKKIKENGDVYPI